MIKLCILNDWACVPQGTKVLLSLTSVMLDESEWKTPFSFNPANFLDEKDCFTRRDAALFFGGGELISNTF